MTYKRPTNISLRLQSQPSKDLEDLVTPHPSSGVMLRAAQGTATSSGSSIQKLRVCMMIRQGLAQVSSKPVIPSMSVLVAVLCTLP